MARQLFGWGLTLFLFVLPISVLQGRNLPPTSIGTETTSNLNTAGNTTAANLKSTPGITTSKASDDSTPGITTSKASVDSTPGITTSKASDDSTPGITTSKANGDSTPSHTTPKPTINMTEGPVTSKATTEIAPEPTTFNAEPKNVMNSSLASTTTETFSSQSLAGTSGTVSKEEVTTEASNARTNPTTTLHAQTMPSNDSQTAEQNENDVVNEVIVSAVAGGFAVIGSLVSGCCVYKKCRQSRGQSGEATNECTGTTPVDTISEMVPMNSHEIETSSSSVALVRDYPGVQAMMQAVCERQNVIVFHNCKINASRLTGIQGNVVCTGCQIE